EPRGPAERQPDEEGAEPAGRHGPDRGRRATPAVGDDSPEPAAEGTAGDDRERRGARVEPGVVAPAAHGEAVGEERGDPRPHRVELPHVTEVSEARQPRAARAE